MAHHPLVLFLSLLLPLPAPAASRPVDLILWNGKIATMDTQNRIVSAVAVRGDRISAVGSDTKIKALAGPKTGFIDLQGRFAMPGFIDSHGHFLTLGFSKMQLDLSSARSWVEIVSRVAEIAKTTPPGEWIRGFGWHQEKWSQSPKPAFNGMPEHTLLSEAAPDNPVLLMHASGHCCLANLKAMQISGIEKNTPDPPGGTIIRNSEGEPTGAFLETAEKFFFNAIQHREKMRTPNQRRDLSLKAVRLAQEECLRHGVTSFHDAGVAFTTVDLYRQLAETGKLNVRIYAMLNENNAALTKHIQRYRLIGAGNHHLTVRSIKRLIDGALGSHGAWLLAPYNSLPESTGLNTESIEAMHATAAIAEANGFQLCTHAIGDRANRETLNIYETIFKANPKKEPRRWRIEHAQHLDPIDIPRFPRLGVIAAMQGIHCTSDAPWVLKRLGKARAESGAYVWRRLIDAKTMVSNGTDVPVESIDPIACFAASVTRRQADGKLFFPDQRMTRQEALRSYTINGAYAAFEEKIKGSLEPGKLADMVVLSGDLLTVSESDLSKVRVETTIVGGRVVFEKK